LLRTLINAAGTAALLATASFAQNLPDEASHGQIIKDAFEDAEELGASLKERLKLFEKEFDLPNDLAERALDSLQNGRVRELLGVPPDDVAPGQRGEGEERRYTGGVFLFASFSIPDPSLHALLKDAADLGVPVYFNGFVENSVVETEKRVRAIYEGEDISHGFGIDPTLFERFNVKAVPTLVSTTVEMDVCETTDCSGDLTPAHDRIAGNVPLRRALELIARGDGQHWEPAADILDGER